MSAAYLGKIIIFLMYFICFIIFIFVLLDLFGILPREINPVFDFFRFLRELLII